MKLLKIAIGLFVLSSAVFGLFLTTRSQTDEKKEYRIIGLVQDANGLPMSGIFVENRVIKEGPWSARNNGAVTGQDGRFVIENAEKGNNWIAIPNNGDRHLNILSIAGPGTSVTVTVSDENPSPGVVIQASSPTPVISGKILDLKTKKKADEAQIKMCLVSDPERCSGVMFIEDDGSFTVAAPINEQFTFSVLSPNHKTFKLKQKNNIGMDDEALTMKSGEKHDVTVSLEPKP